MADWEREVTESGLPAKIKAAYDEASTASSSGFLGKLAKKLKGGAENEGAVFKGVYPSSAAAAAPSSGTSTPSAAAAPTRLSILSSSLLSSSDSHDIQSVIVLPDFKVVHKVGETKEAASELVESYLRPAVGRAGVSLPQSVLRSWPLPYSAVVLLCEPALILLHLRLSILIFLVLQAPTNAATSAVTLPLLSFSINSTTTLSTTASRWMNEVMISPMGRQSRSGRETRRSS